MFKLVLVQQKSLFKHGIFFSSLVHYQWQKRAPHL